ncbi:MAG: insulinase family protein [Bacteroidales bacterium]|nr:insulinase family protein [Bacteroidales bacterium]
MKRILITLALVVAAAASAFSQTREQLEAMIAQMPQIPNSKEVRIGKLENGLTYYIRKNQLPAQRAEFYLATNVGAIQEEYPSQDGLAHFLEHMCFNGTANFPGKAILNYLRSIGAEFGRNINASTGFEETQYMLNNIPVARESVVDTCLMILRDYSHYVLNEPAEIDAERGVIIEERRQRRDAGWRSMEASLPIYFGEGTPMAQHTLIGRQEHLETFSYQSLVDFYRTWYNPCNQAVVVVGDVDVDRTEAKIKEFFGPIPAKEDQKPKAHLTIADHDTPRVGIITDPETTSPSIELNWHSEAAPEAINATMFGKVNDLVKSIISRVMSERFNDITSNPSSPYLNGFFGFSSLIYEDIDTQMGGVDLREDNILGGFRDFYTELVRLQKYGISDAEYDRAKTNIITAYENRVNKADTRRNPEFVRPILNHFFDKEPILEPSDALEMYKMLLGQVNAQAINQVASQLLGKENLIVIYTGPQKDGIATPTEADILKVIDEVNASDIAAPQGEEIPDSFLDPDTLKGGKVKKYSSSIYDATEWTLKNGVKVVVYPTELTKDQILFNIYKDGGQSLIATEDLASFDRSILGLFINNSGVSKFSGTTVSKMLTGKSLSVTPYIDGLEHGINGNSTVKDLETAFQLIYLMFTDPRFDQEEWNNGIEQLNSVLPNMVNQPNYKFSSRMTKTVFGNNPRREYLSAEKVSKASLQVLEKYYRKLFKGAKGAKMVIVGDINPATLQPLVEKYIGSLPTGGKTKWKDTKEYVVKGIVDDVFTVDMQTPKSTVLQVYNADIPYSYAKDAAMDAISYILDMRYTESLREEEGGTYGASAITSFGRRPKENALIQVYFDCKPAMCDKLRELAVKGIQELAQKGPSEEEVSMAKLNLLKNIPESRQQNRWWLNSIELYLTYGEDRNAEYEAAVNALDANIIKQTVSDILGSGNFIDFVMKPAQTAEAE